MEDYLQKILRARVYDVAEETPLEKAKNLSKKFENNIWFKREDLQPVFSFNIRMKQVQAAVRQGARRSRLSTPSNREESSQRGHSATRADYSASRT